VRVALTFDDGPSAWTIPVAIALRDAGSHGTFFVSGHSALLHDRALRTVTWAGNEIGNHGWSHVPLGEIGEDDALYEIERTGTELERILGRSQVSKLWRPPYHSTTKALDLLVYERLGLTRVYRDIDPGDWHHTEDEIVERVLAEVFDGAIINLHDGLPPGGGAGHLDRLATVHAVWRILAEGITSHTVSDMRALTA
jgi:peptidoglycan/xylan/chitin deacetylase (PgdA/CDA1 family)